MARQYYSVAQRRAVKASARDERQVRMVVMNPQSTTYRTIIERLEVEEAEKNTEALGLGKKGYRVLEDPALVGEEAAERARLERVARENGDAILIREDRRWDWLLGKWYGSYQRINQGLLIRLALTFRNSSRHLLNGLDDVEADSQYRPNGGLGRERPQLGEVP